MMLHSQKKIETGFSFSFIFQRPGSNSSGMSGKETTSEVSSKMDITHVNTAENYIAEVTHYWLPDLIKNHITVWSMRD